MPKKYAGPDELQNDVVIALGVLGKDLTVKAITCDSHTLLMVNGFATPDTLKASAVYLVGAIAQCIDADLRIRKALFEESPPTRELSKDVVSVIGSEEANDNFKTMTRDPWIWEGLSHLVIHLSSGAGAFHPPGTVLAKTNVKYDVKDHGLDLVAIYDCGELGITAGESKAYLDNPTRAVSDAANRLREIDENLRDVEMRACVTQLRPSLKEKHRKKLGRAFWKDERSYFPFVCCDSDVALNWEGKRNVLDRLNPTVSRKLLVPLALMRARETFDEIARLVRGYSDGSLTF